MAEDDCCRDGGMYGEGLLGVWDTSDGSYFVQAIGTNVFVL